MKKSIVFLVVFIIGTNVISAQWTKGKGKGYYKLSTWFMEANQHYNDIGVIDPNATRGNLITSFYGEYGLTDKLDVIAYVPFFTRTYQNEQQGSTRGTVLIKGASLNSFGDTDLGIRYSLIKKNNLALSATLKFGIPIGNTNGGHDQAILQAGDGEFNQNLQFDLGIPFSLGSFPAYAKALVGYNNRSQGFSDEIHLGGELGVNLLSNKLWLVGKLFRLRSTKNGTLTAASTNGSIFANNIEYTSLSIEGAYYLTKKLGVSYSYSSAISGRIIAAAPSHSFGVFLDIK